MSLSPRALSIATLLASLAFTSSALAQAPGVPVTVAKAEHKDMPIFRSGIGTAQAFQSVLVRARVDGEIQQIAFTEGQEVKPGDLLAVIDPRPYQAVYDQAIANKSAHVAMLGNAKRDLARYTDLARSDFASRQSVDTQTASVTQSQAQTQADDAAIAAAKLNLEFTRVTAPIGGRVGLRLVDPGNQVRAADAAGIVTINQIHPISVVFTLPQDNLVAVQDAMRASQAPLTVIAYASDDRQKLGEGELMTIDNAIDTNTGTIKLKAKFANADDRLWPGEFINAHLQISLDKNAVVVPSAAVQRGVNGLYVYLVKPDNTAVLQAVEIGQDDGTQTIVTKGLSGGEQVVTAGQSRLTSGTRVALNQPAGQPGQAKAGG